MNYKILLSSVQKSIETSFYTLFRLISASTIIVEKFGLNEICELMSKGRRSITLFSGRIGEVLISILWVETTCENGIGPRNSNAKGPTNFMCYRQNSFRANIGN